MYYQVPLKISKQEDGLWRVEAPSLQGCFVDEPTLAEALYQIHEVIAMLLDLNQEEGRPLPPEVQVSKTLPLYASIAVAPDEVEEIPGVNSQGRTRRELLENLRSALKEALELNQAEALAATTGEYEEVSLEA